MRIDGTFYKTFSGTDTLAFILFPDSKPILLGSITTISYSMYRDKKPVSSIGRINVRGFTRGMRIIAGSLIFTVYNQHIVKDIVENVPYLKAYNKMKTDELPIFDIMIVSANEYGASSQMMIYGVDITDDAGVISIEDIFSENTFSFVARDIDEFAANSTVISQSNMNGKSIPMSSNTIMPVYLSYKEIDEAMKAVNGKFNDDDIKKVQKALVKNNMIAKVTGVYDSDTFNAVKEIQKTIGETPNGVLNEFTYNYITNENKAVTRITNRTNTYVYTDYDKTKIMGILKYKDSVRYNKDKIKNKMLEIEYRNHTGYIDIEHTELSKRKVCEITDIVPSGPCVNHVLDMNNETDFSDGLSSIGAYVEAFEDIDVKITAVSHFKDKSIDINCRYLPLKANDKRKMVLSYLPNSYVYNIYKKSLPEYIEFFIFVTNEKPRKWLVKMV